MLPQYLLCSNRAGLPQPIILCTEKPYMLAKVWTFERHQDYLDKMYNNTFTAFTPIDGYMIIISFAGTLGGPVLTITPSFKYELDKVLEGMKAFYYNERIDAKLGYYKKYLIK